MTKPRKLLTLAALSVFLALPAASAHASTDTTAPPDTILVPIADPGDADAKVPVIDVEAEVGHEALEHADSLASIKMSSTVVNFIVQTLIPIALGALLKYRPKWMTVAGIVASAVSSYIVSVTTTDGTAVFTSSTAWLFFTGLITSLFMYARVWKPLGLTNAPGGKLGTNNGI